MTEFAPCGCGCGCSAPSGVPRTGSAVLDRHARCPRCAAEHQDAPAPALPSVSGHRPVTDLSRPLDEESLALDAQIAEQQRRAIAEQAWTRWQESLPERFRNASTDHPKVLARLDRLRQGEYGSSGMVVLGPPGLGKTWIAVAYANAAIQQGLVKASEVLFGTEAEILASAANAAFGEVEHALRRLTSRRYRMLVVDDVGRGTWLRDEMRARVFSLVFDAAWRDNRILVVTTNLTREALPDYIGEGAFDRLRSVCGYDSVVLEKRDMRRATTEQRMASLVSRPAGTFPSPTSK